MASTPRDGQFSSQFVDGDWLCAPSDYLNYITHSCKYQPGLRQQDPGNLFAPLRERSARVALVELEASGKPFCKKDLTLEELKSYLPRLDASQAEQREQKRRTFIMEGLTREFVQAFGESFGIEPSFFAMQERKGTTFSFNENLDRPILPSLLQPEKSFCMRYYELWAYTGGVGLQDLDLHCAEKGDLTLWCKQTGRPIIWHAWRHRRGATGHGELLLLVPRKCSVWIKKRNATDWDTVVLCDPVPSATYQEWSILSSDSPSNCDAKNIFIEKEHIKPFDGGYDDFILRPDDGYHDFIKKLKLNNQPTPGPPRTSMLDDVLFYYNTHGAILTDFEDPALFVKKITAAHYMQLTGFVKHQLESIRNADWSGQDDRAGNARGRSSEDKNPQGKDSIETQWGRFRCSQYVYDLEATLLDLGIVQVDQSTPIDKDRRSSEADFQHISRSLAALRADYDRLTTSMVGLGGMIRNKQALVESTQSLREAKTVKTLTFIAMFYIPLGWLSGLFSMSGRFAPGAADFWVYFAVSTPVLLLTFVTNSLIQLGYDDRANWSFETFLISIQHQPAKFGRIISLIRHIFSPNGAEKDVDPGNC